MNDSVRWHINNTQQRLKALEEQVYELQKKVVKPTPLLEGVDILPLVFVICVFLTLCVFVLKGGG